jgi:DNA-binding PadR family transcriptional regulator
MTEKKVVHPVDRRNLPPELVANLKAFTTADGYSMRDLVLAYMGKFDEASLDDLMIYIYKVRNRVASRGYMYQLIYRLRRDGLVQALEKQTPHNVVYRLTTEGLERAPAFLNPRTGEVVE